MPLFPRKKQCEVTYIDQYFIVVGKDKYHKHDYELVYIRKLVEALNRKVDKILKGGGTNDDSGKIQALIDKVDIIIEDIKKTV